MEAGKLRHRVEFQEADESAATNPGAFGDVIPAWRTRHTRWARVRPATGKEIWRAAQVQASVQFAIDVRGAGLEDMTAKWRIKWGSRLFGIGAILDQEERGIMLTILCTEGPTEEGA